MMRSAGNVVGGDGAGLTVIASGHVRDRVGGRFAARGRAGTALVTARCGTDFDLAARGSRRGHIVGGRGRRGILRSGVITFRTGGRLGQGLSSGDGNLASSGMDDSALFERVDEKA